MPSRIEKCYLCDFKEIYSIQNKRLDRTVYLNKRLPIGYFADYAYRAHMYTCDIKMCVCFYVSMYCLQL